MSLWLVGIPLLFFATSLLLFKMNRTGLAPSFMLTASVFSALALLALYLYHSGSELAVWLLVIALILMFAVIGFGIYALIAFLLINTWIILHKETRTLAHCLTLVLALALITYLIVMRVLESANPPYVLVMIDFWIQGLVFFYAVHISQFVIAVSLCNLSRPRKNRDYIVVLGAGLIDGKVTPLLAGRIDRAITFYERQKQTGAPPKLIMSGGQGGDESRPEAEAMVEYARERGIPDEHLLPESKSTTTLENMQFSKRIMDEDSGDTPYRAIYATNNYHLLRAGIYARRAGLKMIGIGSKTKFYYLPNALLREYVAYIVLYKRPNIVFLVISLLLSLASSFVLLALV